MLEIDLPKSEIDKLSRFFDATTAELKKASVRTVRKTGNWVKTISAREISRQTGVQQKFLKNRIKTFTNASKVQGRVWFGVYPLSMIRLGARQMKKGVKAGKIFREGAFIAPIKSSTKNKFQVFKRVGKKRLPIKKQVVEIDKQVTSAIENTVLGQIPDKMISNLQQELRWELSKR